MTTVQQLSRSLYLILDAHHESHDHNILNASNIVLLIQQIPVLIVTI